MNKPFPDILRPELAERVAPGLHEPSVIQFGCLDCPNGHRLIGAWLPLSRLIEMVDSVPDTPAAFVYDKFESMSQAKPCPVDDNTQQPVCEHADALQNILKELHSQ